MSETPVSTAKSYKQKALRPSEELSCLQTSQSIRRKAFGSSSYCRVGLTLLESEI